MQDPQRQVTLGDTNLEHIYPQDPAATGWGGSANQEKLEPFTWHIGNLTIFGKKANRKVANDEYSDKRKGYASSKVVMTNQIATAYTKWDENNITDRAKKLAKTVVLIWEFNNTSRV